MTEQELSERHEALTLVNLLDVSPQGVQLFIRSRYEEKRIPLEFGYTGGTLSGFELLRRDVLRTLETDIVKAVKQAHSHLLKFALEEKH